MFLLMFKRYGSRELRDGQESFSGVSDFERMSSSQALSEDMRQAIEETGLQRDASHLPLGRLLLPLQNHWRFPWLGTSFVIAVHSCN